MIKPFHQAGVVVSVREFTVNAFNHHHGMQAEERFDLNPAKGFDQDFDEDGVERELTVGDITAATIFQAALGVPGQVLPRRPAERRSVREGEAAVRRARLRLLPPAGPRARRAATTWSPIPSTRRAPSATPASRSASTSPETASARGSSAAARRRRPGPCLHRSQAPQPVRRAGLARCDPLLLQRGARSGAPRPGRPAGHRVLPHPQAVGRGQLGSLRPSRRRDDHRRGDPLPRRRGAGFARPLRRPARRTTSGRSSAS